MSSDEVIEADLPTKKKWTKGGIAFWVFNVAIWAWLITYWVKDDTPAIMRDAWAEEQTYPVQARF